MNQLWQEKVGRLNNYEAFKAKVSLGVSLVIILIYSVGTPIRNYVHPLTTAARVGFTLAYILIIYSAFSIWRDPSKQTGRYGVLASLFLMVLMPAYQNGGLDAPIVPLLILFPLLAAFLIGVRAAKYVFGLTLITNCIIYILSVQGALPASGLEPGVKLQTCRLILDCCITALSFAIALLYERTRTQINKELIASSKLAESSSKSKAMFLANMSHEIRTPLNGIIGNTLLLRETSLTEDQLGMVDTIRSSSDALLALIDDILDFSKIEAGKLQIEQKPFDIRRAIKDAVNILKPRADEKALYIRVSVANDVPDILISDYARFRQVLLNLLSNAVKFTDKGGVEVVVKAVKVADDSLSLQTSVKDSGIGLTSEQQGKLFQDFSQVDASTTRKYGGTGLGLAICKHLCSLLGGKIWVESEVGKGSLFAFTIATKSGEGLEPENVPRLILSKSESVLGAEHPLRILVAEDNKVNQTLAIKFMKKFGYDVDLVENGDEAVKAMGKTNYDVIFMDVHMPILDGYEATRAIRAKKKTDQPFIIALTASVMQRDRQLCFDAGMDDFLKKPVDMSDLATVLQKAIAAKTSGSGSDQNIELSAILKRFDNDFDMFRAVAEVYLREYQNYIVGIEKCLKSRDSHGLEEAAHIFKGAANNVSSTLVTAVVGQMEMLGYKDNVNEAAKLFDQLVNESAHLATSLSRFISEKGAE